MQSAIFRLNGPEIDFPEAIIALCDAINAEEETDWYMGECLECSLSDLIPAAHWALSEWHAGQSSMLYAALCATGSIFKPGMSAGPEPGSAEESAYEMISAYFEKNPHVL